MPHVHLLIAGGTAQRRLIETTMAKLESRGYEPGTRQEGGDWHALLTENRGAGLFGDRSIVTVDDAEKLGPMPIQLAPLLEAEGAAVVILLVCKSESANPIPKDLLKKCTVSKATEPSPWSKERDTAIVDAVKARGISIRPEGISLLKELFEDVGELISETEKLAGFCEMTGKKEISRREIEMLCLTDGSRSLLKLLDGICTGAYVESLEHLELLNRGGELLPLVSALHNRARLAYYAAVFPSDRPLFAKTLGARDYAWRQAESAAKRYGREKLLDFVANLIRINAGEKSGLGGGWRDLQIAIVALMSG